MPSPSTPESRRNRTIIGCLALFGAAGLCVVTTVGGGFLYFFTTPASVPVASVVGPGTVAVVRVRGNTADPGIAALAVAVADALTAMQVSAQKGQPLPPSIQWIQPIQAWNNRRSAAYLVPLEMGVVVEEVAGGTATGEVILFSPRQLPRLYGKGLGWVFSRAPGGSVTRRGSVDVVQLGPTTFAAIARGTLLFSSSQDALFAVVDRIDAAPASSPLAERLAALGTALDGEAVIRAGAPMAPDARACALLAAVIDVVDADHVSVRFDAQCDREDPQVQGEFVEGALANLRAILPPGLTLTARHAPTGSGVSGDAELAGLGTWLGTALGGGSAASTPAGPAEPAEALQEGGDEPER